MTDGPPKSERPRYRLEDLLVGMTPEAMRETFAWDEGKDDRGVIEDPPESA
jgi:hypothetical protein